MSKKAILGTLLASAALLGTSTVTHAATSDIKAESKKVTVTSDKAKLYKDSKLKESTTPKKGTVYQVDGYRDIDGKHVYRVYQTDKDNKQQYKGYIVNKDTKELKSDKASGQYVAKKGATLWNNFYWNSKKAVTSEEKVYFAKYSYTLGDGAKYYSIYYKDKDGKDVWAGYTNASNVKELQATEETKYVTLKKDYNTWANLYFKQHKDDFKAEKGVNFKVKRYYTLNGNKFYSTYRTNAEGEEVWTGYVNGYSSVVEDLKANKVADNDQKVQVVKDYNTYKDHFFNKNGQLKVGQNITMKYIYTYGNDKKYVSLYDDNKWLGYANLDAVQSTQELDQAVNKAKDTIQKAKDILSKAQASTASKEAAQKVIDEAEKLLDTPVISDLNKIKEIPSNLEAAMKNLKPAASSSDLEALGTAIRDAKEVIKNADELHLTNVEKVQTALENAEKVYNDGKNANNEEIAQATTALNEALKEVGFDKKPLEDAVKKLKETEANVYLTKDQEAQLKNKITEVVNKVDSTDAEDAPAAKDALDTINKAIKEMNDKQPNREDANELIKQLKVVNDINKLPDHGKGLDNKDEVTAPLRTAVDDYKALLKDQPSNNQATTELTKEDIKNATKALKGALDQLKLNQSGLNDIVKKAQSYNGRSSAEVKEKLEILESWVKFPSFKNYNHIENSARAVYNVILSDLRAVIRDVRPWNNNGYSNDPSVKYIHTRTLKNVPLQEAQVAEGSNLTEEQFSKYVLKGANKVSDYYTTESYKPFGEDIEKASILSGELDIVGRPIPAPTVSQLVQNFNDATTLGDKLKEECNNLTFDKEKLQKLVTDGQKAKDTWLNQEMKDKHNTSNQATNQAKQANIGFYQMKTWLEKTPSLKATEEIANTMWNKIYNAMNYYYKYITTVKWDSNSNKYVSTSSDEEK